MADTTLAPVLVNIGCRLPATMVAELDAIAESTPGVSMFYPPTRSSLIRDAIQAFIKVKRQQAARADR